MFVLFLMIFKFHDISYYYIISVIFGTIMVFFSSIFSKRNRTEFLKLNSTYNNIILRVDVMCCTFSYGYCRYLPAYHCTSGGDTERIVPIQWVFDFVSRFYLESYGLTRQHDNNKITASLCIHIACVCIYSYLMLISSSFANRMYLRTIIIADRVKGG